jgi:hypothetical protein
MSCNCDMHGRKGLMHCRACCLTFSGITAFDMHLVRSGHRAPQESGLVLVRPGVWGKPGSRPSFLLRGEREAS